MAISEAGAHILVFPYPAQGHMIPLLDLTHQLALRNLTITVLVTPKNLHYLKPLLIKHPSIQPLVLPFPATSSIPDGVENVRDLPPGGFRKMTLALADLYDPIVNWFQHHLSPPVAIVSDMFLGWTHQLATNLNIKRFVFSPSGALSLSIMYNLWHFMPKRNDPNDDNEVHTFEKIPNCPSYPWWKISPLFRSYVEGEQQSEVLKESLRGNIASWGLVVNSFNELERVYLDYLKEFLGHDRVWAVGPLLPPVEEQVQRGGSTGILASEIKIWLDQFKEKSVVYVCFGSQAVLTNEQMEKLALGLEKSGVPFIWSYKDPTKGHVAGNYSSIPPGFKDRVAGRGLIVKGWAPQVPILTHSALGAFLTHCGWNSVLESITAGVPMLTWPMGADQFENADLLDEFKVGTRVCEGALTVPDSDELARLVAKLMSDNQPFKMARAKELSKAALESIENEGPSYGALNSFVNYVSKAQPTF
ncbi:UDP-glycosyltransferase 89B2-like [Apium graveolens]|uniref:UDP-glycosyltransferase 89B2-like n=1 Tax=Apium graveolens TaxID=4045 RepID=UPI003D7BBBD2